MASLEAPPRPLNYFRDPDLRKELFDRDKWVCRYCGERLSAENATLDHLVPVSKGGADSPENLATCCFLCNSIKSGKTYEESAPAILTSLQQRKVRIARPLDR
ncbi:MAG: HNH endonuclease [Nitrospiraceae bacterium]